MRNETNFLLADIDQQIYRVIFFFMTTGGFPQNWSSDVYSEFLSNRQIAMRIYIFCFSDGEKIREHRKSISEQIEEKMPYVCAKTYNDMVVCLSFEKEDMNASTSRALLHIIQAVAGEIPTCYESEYMTDTEVLIEKFQDMRVELDAIRAKTACSRDKQVMNLFTMENLLFDQIVDGDIECLSISLSELADIVEEANRIYIPDEDELFISTKLYFSYLWRRIARVIYERTGQRKTIQRGVKIDLEVRNVNNRKDLLNLVQNYVIQLSDELNLTNKGSFHKIIENVKKYIDVNYANNVSLKHVAGQIGLSSYYLSKLFKKEEGINFKDYVIMVRMEKALDFIHNSNMNINEIAYAVGYTNSNYFSQAFHEYYGVLPKACKTKGLYPKKR